MTNHTPTPYLLSHPVYLSTHKTITQTDKNDLHDIGGKSEEVRSSTTYIKGA